MKALYLLLIAVAFLYANQVEVTISDQKYIVSEDSYNEYGEKGSTLTLYNANSKTAVLSFTTYERYGGCGKRNYKESVYEIAGENLTIYDKWSGYDIKGYRKMVYHFEGGRAKLISSKFYIIDKSMENGKEVEKLLKLRSKDSKQEEALKHYIDSMERSYKGEFIIGEAKDELSASVERAFEKSMKDRWGR
jgi:hypothetical protein